MVSISAPSIRNTFAVLRRFMECLLREFTAMNARPPAIRPAALLLVGEYEFVGDSLPGQRERRGEADQ